MCLTGSGGQVGVHPNSAINPKIPPFTLPNRLPNKPINPKIRSSNLANFLPTKTLTQSPPLELPDLLNTPSNLKFPTSKLPELLHNTPGNVKVRLFNKHTQ